MSNRLADYPTATANGVPTVTQRAQHLLARARNIRVQAGEIERRVIEPAKGGELGQAGVQGPPEPEHLSFHLNECERVLDEVANILTRVSEAL